MRSPRTEQGCYDLGYENPTKSSRDFEWMHLVDVNAYRCGQLDRQNHAPRNSEAERFGVSRCSISSIHCGRMYASSKQTALRAEQVKAIVSAKGSRRAKELAAELGISHSTIYRIWNGQSHQHFTN